MMDVWNINVLVICILPVLHISAVSGLNCSFDDGSCDWKYNAGDWSYSNTSVSKEMIGPSGDHTTGEGYFLYANAKSNASVVNLTSSTITSGQYCASIWYFMVGQNVKSLKIISKTSTSDTNRALSIWGNQGRNWKEAIVDLSSDNESKIVIEANFNEQHEGSFGYIGVDDITISPGLCSLDCTFNDGLCAWRQFDNPFKWSRKRYDDSSLNSTHSSSDKTDFYLNVNKGTGTNKAGTAALFSPLQPPGTTCLTFQMSLLGNTSDALSVFFKDENRDVYILIWSMKNVSHTTLHRQFIDISSNTIGVNYRIKFVGKVAPGGDGNILIDNIKSTDGQCKYGCESSPCVNNGTCKDGTRGNYSCVCFDGWNGRNCNNSASTVSHTGSTYIPMIVYIVIPVGIVVLVITVRIVVYLWRRQKRRHRQKNNGEEEYNSEADNETGEANLTELSDDHQRQSDAKNHSMATDHNAIDTDYTYIGKTYQVPNRQAVNNVNDGLTKDLENINDVAAHANLSVPSNDEGPLYANVVKGNASANDTVDLNEESSYDILGTAEKRDESNVRMGDSDYDTFETVKFKSADNPIGKEDQICDSNYINTWLG